MRHSTILLITFVGFAADAGAAPAAGKTTRVFHAYVSESQPEAVPNLVRTLEPKVRVSDFWKHPTKGEKVLATGAQAVNGGFGSLSRWQTAGKTQPVWIELDFGRAATFDTVRLYMTETKSGRNAPGPIRVLVGQASPPTGVVFRADAAKVSPVINRSVYENHLIQFPEQTARYLQVEFASKDVCLDEIEVFRGQPPARSSTYEPGDTRLRVRESVRPQVLARGLGNLLVWFENGAEKVFRDEVVRDDGAPADPVCHVSAAKGESEPFQVVLFCSDGLKQVRLTAGDLKGPAVIPAACVRWYQVGYASVRLPSSKLVSQLGRNEGLGRGWYPDPLLPVEVAAAPAGKHQPLWFVVDVPRDTPAGDYKGVLTLTAAGGVSVPLQLILRVHDFDMPFPRHFKTMGRENGSIYRDFERTKAWFKHLSTVGFTGMSIFPCPPQITEEAGRLKFDWTQFDAMARFCIEECSFDAMALPGDVFAYHEQKFAPARMVGRKVKADSPAFWSSLEESLSEYGCHLRERGWSDKFIFYVTDEPSASVQSYLLRVIEVAHRTMPGVKVLWIGGWVYPNLIGHVDIWGPNAKNFETQAYSERAAAGDKVWTYSNALWLIDTPPLGCRALGWAYAKYGIAGVFFYSLNKWEDNPYEMSHNNPTRNGDPMFLYPDPVGRPDRFVNSIRLELLRDGWDDWEYVRQARERLKATESENPAGPLRDAIQEARSALAEADQIVTMYGFPSVPNRKALIEKYEQNPDDVLPQAMKRGLEPARFDYVHDSTRLLRVRDHLAHAIELLGDGAKPQAVSKGGR